METDSSSRALPLHILYRLALSKYFVREAKAKLQHSSDDLALSLTVVNLHDGLDNLLGAVASRLSVDLPEKASLVSTFESISRVEALPHKMEINQLNALRIDIKHKGLVPNPKTVLSLAPVLEEFCDQACNRFFQRTTLMQVSLVDAIDSPRLREGMRQIEDLIEDGKHKEALESMAFVIFREFDANYVDEFGGGFGPLAASLLEQPRPLPEEQKRVFPSPPVDLVHRIFLEMGIEPDLYYRFHNIVPKVGYDNLRDRNLIVEKDRSTWHIENWTRENCWFCFDFLISYLVRRQKGYRGYTIIRRHWKDKIRFIRDSTMYEFVEGQRVEIAMKAGASLIGSVRDYVDGAWQGDPDDPLADVTLFVESPVHVRFVRVLKQDVEVFADEEIGHVLSPPW